MGVVQLRSPVWNEGEAIIHISHFSLSFYVAFEFDEQDHGSPSLFDDPRLSEGGVSPWVLDVESCQSAGLSHGKHCSWSSKGGLKPAFPNLIGFTKH